MSLRPTTISIFLAEGEPDGLRVVSKSNWTGVAVVASRPQLGPALQRDELSRPGVYVLTGPGEGASSRLYVGEADVLRKRLGDHGRRKDFWTQLIAFTSSDHKLNKAHVRYLEARLLQLAARANQWELDNGTAPEPPPLSEQDQADADWFLEEMLVIYPILGVDAFEAASQERPSQNSIELRLDERGAKGTGRETKDGFVVVAGSRARATETGSIHDHLRDLRTQLQQRGVLVPDGNQLVFTQDYRFNSPSTAAGVLVGGSANGRRAWRTTDGRTLKSVQDSRTEVAG